MYSMLGKLSSCWLIVSFFLAWIEEIPSIWKVILYKLLADIGVPWHEEAFLIKDQSPCSLTGDQKTVYALT